MSPGVGIGLPQRAATHEGAARAWRQLRPCIYYAGAWSEHANEALARSARGPIHSPHSQRTSEIAEIAAED